jgi:ubiquinone/menaquinone biosynthesis C-methylase UbiE
MVLISEGRTVQKNKVSGSELTNADSAVVDGFGKEWSAFDQSGTDAAELRAIFDRYFAIFPREALNHQAVGFDAGCGSGRWAMFVAPCVKTLHCIDASSEALGVSRRNLSNSKNVVFHQASVGDMPIPDASMDFGYSLGVLHHLPDTQAALTHCASKLKPGAPFLLYLYYAFDNRPAWFRSLWKLSDLARQAVSRLPFVLQRGISDCVAALMYWPLARAARLLQNRTDVSSFPLSFYRNRSFYVMRNDALDRLATKLEKRFTRAEILGMMKEAGFRDVNFSATAPYWCAVGYRKILSDESA